MPRLRGPAGRVAFRGTEPLHSYMRSCDARSFLGVLECIHISEELLYKMNVRV